MVSISPYISVYLGFSLCFQGFSSGPKNSIPRISYHNSVYFVPQKEQKKGKFLHAYTSFLSLSSISLTSFSTSSYPKWVYTFNVDCYPAPQVLQIFLIFVKLNEGTGSYILMYFTAECLNQYLLVLSYQSYKNSRHPTDQSLIPAIIIILTVLRLSM